MSDQARTAGDPAAESEGSLTIHSLLRGLVKHKASDLHIRSGRPPMYRINGKLVPTKLPNLTAETVKNLAYSTMTSKQIIQFEAEMQIDFGYVVPGLARFRANVFLQKSSVGIVVRTVPLDVPVFESLGLPEVVKDLASKHRGLLLVTGSTGSGKSTTLAALVDYINRTARSHVITIEDPIEFIHEDKLSTITQREMGIDAMSMSSAMRAALRQDPDIIMIGEMRDYETMQIAITAAETGHLVMSTLHTNTAAQSIDRILDSFPAEAKNQVRMQLAASLVGVVTQRLVKKADGSGQIAACEVLTKSPTIERLIWENRLSEIESSMEGSSLYYKMQSMNQALIKLVQAKIITVDEAIRNSDHQEDLRLKLSGMVGGGQRGINAGDFMNQSGHSNSSEVQLNDSGVRVESLVVDKKKAG